MTLLLSEADVERALDMRETIDALDESFRALDAGQAVNRPRSHSYNALDGNRHHLFKTMDGGVLPLGVHALRMSSDIVSEERSETGVKRVKIPAAPGERYVGLVVLFDIHRLVPTAIMPDGYLQRMRVGATSALAARHLARRDSTTVGLVGAGWQAGAQLLALAADRDLDEIKVYGPTAERVDGLIARLTEHIDARMRAVASAREAIEGMDIVALATNSMVPVIDGSWLAPGQHVGSVQGYELDDATFHRAHVIGVRSLEPSTYHYAPGKAPLEAKSEPEVEERIRAKMVELGSIVSGARGRVDDAQITLFTGSHSGASSGLGIQFAAVGHAVATRARRLGLGQELPTDWFTQSGKP